MLLRVNIHEKYVRAENNEAIYFLKQNQFIIAGAPGKGRMVRGAPSMSVRAAPCQLDRSLSAFFQAIIFGMTGDFDHPIKLL